MSIMLMILVSAAGEVKNTATGQADLVTAAVGIIMAVYGAFYLVRLIRIWPWLGAWYDYTMQAIETPGMPRISPDAIPSYLKALDPGNGTLESMARDPEGFRRLREWVNLRKGGGGRGRGVSVKCRGRLGETRKRGSASPGLPFSYGMGV